MLIYGKNVLREVLRKKELINKIYLDNFFNDKDLLDLIQKNNVKYVRKDTPYLNRLVDGLHQGIVIEIKPKFYVELDNIIDKSNFVVMLDHLEDPHNFGAIIRTCECAGVDAIIIPNKNSVDVNSTVMKTSSGALINSKICKVANLNNTIKKLKDNGFWIVGTDAKGTNYTNIDYSGKICLIIGSEGTGLKQIVKNSCDYIASLPMKGQINSLNASVSAGIMIYEILKFRG